MAVAELDFALVEPSISDLDHLAHAASPNQSICNKKGFLGY